ncbi:MAG: acyl carrier protein [Lachnospiraceae bacterium]|nr:acyl carrier protein [Lachnospiraceae bacterium]
MQTVRRQIIDIIEKYAGKEVVTDGDISLIDDLEFDSLQLVGVLTEIEEKFHISFEQGEKLLDMVDSLDKITEYVGGFNEIS